MSIISMALRGIPTQCVCKHTCVRFAWTDFHVNSEILSKKKSMAYVAERKHGSGGGSEWSAERRGGRGHEGGYRRRDDYEERDRDHG